jgi:hypothetical protein
METMNFGNRNKVIVEVIVYRIPTWVKWLIGILIVGLITSVINSIIKQDTMNPLSDSTKALEIDSEKDLENSLGKNE